MPVALVCLCASVYACLYYYRFPKGLEDVSKYPALIEELISRNWTEEELAGVLRLNFLRVFRKVEKVRKLIQFPVQLGQLRYSMYKS